MEKRKKNQIQDRFNGNGALIVIGWSFSFLVDWKSKLADFTKYTWQYLYKQFSLVEVFIKIVWPNCFFVETCSLYMIDSWKCSFHLSKTFNIQFYQDFSLLKYNIVTINTSM
jgi:hypothetical protein